MPGNIFFVYFEVQRKESLIPEVPYLVSVLGGEAVLIRIGREGLP